MRFITVVVPHTVSPISGRAIVNTSWLHDNYTDITSDVVKINNSTINFTYSYSNNLDVEGDFFNISVSGVVVVVVVEYTLCTCLDIDRTSHLAMLIQLQ